MHWQNSGVINFCVHEQSDCFSLGKFTKRLNDRKSWHIILDYYTGNLWLDFDLVLHMVYIKNVIFQVNYRGFSSHALRHPRHKQPLWNRCGWNLRYNKHVTDHGSCRWPWKALETLREFARTCALIDQFDMIWNFTTRDEFLQNLMEWNVRSHKDKKWRNLEKEVHFRLVSAAATSSYQAWIRLGKLRRIQLTRISSHNRVLPSPVDYKSDKIEKTWIRYVRSSLIASK